MHFNIKNYIVDEEYKIIINKNSIYVYNYDKVLDITDESVNLIIKGGSIKIYGKSIVIKVLDKKEMLITGEFKGILL